LKKKRKRKLYFIFLKNVQKTHGKFGLVPNLTSRFDKLHQKIKMKVQIEPLQLSYFEPPKLAKPSLNLKGLESFIGKWQW
jgi:hypothetical protein